MICGKTGKGSVKESTLYINPNTVIFYKSGVGCTDFTAYHVIPFTICSILDDISHCSKLSVNEVHGFALAVLSEAVKAHVNHSIFNSVPGMVTIYVSFNYLIGISCIYFVIYIPVPVAILIVPAVLLPLRYGLLPDITTYPAGVKHYALTVY